MAPPPAGELQRIDDPKYQAMVGRALDGLLARVQAGEEGAVHRVELATDRLIIFSDQHRGAGNRADDFRRSHRAYNAALAYYFARGHTLVELGDVEELWEERPGAVVRTYGHSMSLSARFHQAGRYFKIWGNHDDNWRYAGQVKTHLAPIFGTTPAGGPLAVHEGVLLEVSLAGVELGRILLAHGHQGTLTSDRFGSVSRFFVRWAWRPFQRLTDVSLNTPAKDWVLREKHNVALYKWAARQQGLVLVAGHTHRPVMRSRSHAALLEATIEEVERTRAAHVDEELAALHAELEWVRAQDGAAAGPEGRRAGAIPMERSCYFNTGCCSYADGKITGLELAGQEIRLVRWPDDAGKPNPQVLATCTLQEAFDLAPVGAG
jgi:hypothetical protein